MSRRSGLRTLALTFSLVFAIAILRAVPSAQRGGETPIVILISFDGWRWDYIDRHPVPNLEALAARGVRARALIPSFPVLTFPNHYTIVTGLYPEHHGIIANNMRDPSIPDRFSMTSQAVTDARWWGGEPIWVTAIRHGRRAATLFWPGSEAPVGGIRPTYWKAYDKAMGPFERVQQTLAWLRLPERERPSLLTLYFEDVDSAGHDFGPESAELDAATRRLDNALGSLVDGVRALGLDDRTSLVVISDHGMTPATYGRVIYLDAYIDLSTVDILESGATLQLSPRDGDVDGLFRKLHGKHPKLEIYRKQDVPAGLHFNDNPRIPAIVGVPADGWSVSSGERLMQEELHVGTHGYLPTSRDMGALFVAAGPSLRQGVLVAPFENIHIYELLCRLLKIEPAHNDGNGAVTRGFLR
jgi:predicted AlkP superfamily pyrophosphatase or phosphodiesterase